MIAYFDIEAVDHCFYELGTYFYYMKNYVNTSGVAFIYNIIKQAQYFISIHTICTYWKFQSGQQ